MKDKKTLKLIGITKEMELHFHGKYSGELPKEWYSNIKITEILDVLKEYTYSIGDEEEADMLDHLINYFDDKIE